MSNRPSLRHEQSQAAQERIVAAAVALIEAGQEPSMRSVSREAGISERTIYRYFATREDLHTAVGDALQARASTPHPASIAGLPAYVKDLFATFEANEGLIRALVTAPWLGDTLRHSRPRHLRALEGMLKSAYPRVSSQERRNAAAALRVAVSGAGWVHLRDCGFSSKQAINQALWLVQTICSQLQSRGDSDASR